MATWGVAKAKAQFSAVLDQAELEGPQLVKRRKQEFFVVTKEQLAKGAIGPVKPEQPFVSAWDSLQPSFEERFDVEFPRVKGKTREVDFGSEKASWDALRCPPQDGVDTDFPRIKGGSREVSF